MANLIPPQARKTVTREYWLRAVTVWMVLAAAAGLVVGVLLIPTYVLISMQHTAYASRVDEVQSRYDAFAEASEEIDAANKLVRYIERNIDAAAATDFVETFDELAGNEVQILRFSFAQDRTEIMPIILHGEAADRTTLANFRDRLEAHAAVAAVVLPISNLAGDQNIPFTMEVILTD